MKKAFVGVAIALAALSPISLMCSCKKDTGKKTFGEFSYNGNYLTEYAKKEITADEARQIISGGTYAASSKTTYSLGGLTVQQSIVNAPETPISLYNSIAEKYGSLEITTKYYTSEYSDVQTKVDYLSGTDMRNIIVSNSYEPFGQLVAKNIVMFDDLITFMEAQNDNFKNSANYYTAPFKNIFTYHTDDRGNLIVQTRDFTELASSVGGGIGCSYRQDTEIIYDSELKVTKWQTSLGVYSATPKGTIKQGYILEIDFDWQLKS